MAEKKSFLDKWSGKQVFSIKIQERGLEMRMSPTCRI